MYTLNAMENKTLLSVAAVCRAIANKVCPSNEVRGIDCIVRKTQEILLVPGNTPSITFRQFISLPMKVSKPELDEQSPTELTFYLGSEDRAWMIKNLPSLSNLSFPYTNNNDKVFLDAFEQLEDAPKWRPVLFSQKDLDRRNWEREEVRYDHMNRLRELVKQGKLRAVTKEHLPVENLSSADFVIAQDVADYCYQCGIDISIEGFSTNTASGDEVPQKSSQTIDESSTKDVLKIFREKLSKNQYRQAFEVLNSFHYIRGTRPLTLEVKKKIAEFHVVLVSENVPAPTLITAKVFKVSDKTVKDLRAQFRPRIHARLGRVSK